MMTRCDCAHAEMLAGAIALGEAGETQRDLYRAHLATCERCRCALGGEREIERVMAATLQARDAERWEPDLRKMRALPRAQRYAWKWAAALAATVALVVGVRATQTHPNVATVAPQPRAASEQAERAIAVLDTQTAPRREHQAESLVLGSATPSTIAFQVSLDARGMPKRCSVTKSSGYRMLDHAVCRAALRTLHSRRPINPR